MGGAEDDLAKSWRRVASTHALQSLLSPEPQELPPRSRRAWIATKLTGLAMLLCAAALLSLHAAHVAALWLPPALLPPPLQLLRTHSQLLFHLAFTFHATAAAVFLHWFSLKLFKHNSTS